jgi:hypothetical protein
MGDCLDKAGRRPDGGHGAVRTDNCATEILRFSLKIFPVSKPRPDGEALSS